MISKKEYHSMMSKLPNHKLPDNFETKVMEKIHPSPVRKAVRKSFYITAYATLIIAFFLVITLSLRTPKPSYTLIGENAKTINNKLSTSILSGIMSQ